MICIIFCVLLVCTVNTVLDSSITTLKSSRSSEKIEVSAVMPMYINRIQVHYCGDSNFLILFVAELHYITKGHCSTFFFEHGAAACYLKF